MGRSKTCHVCGKPITAKDEIGLNKKMLGRKTLHFYCCDCLAEQLEIEVDALLAKVEDFRSQGCGLFG